MGRLQGGELHVICQPPFLFRAELVERASLSMCCFAQKNLMCPRKTLPAKRADLLKINRVFVKSRRVIEISLREPALLDQFVECNEQRVARERRERLIGGIAISRRSEGQHLPDTLPGAGQPINE